MRKFNKLKRKEIKYNMQILLQLTHPNFFFNFIPTLIFPFNKKLKIINIKIRKTNIKH